MWNWKKSLLIISPHTILSQGNPFSYYYQFLFNNTIRELVDFYWAQRLFQSNFCHHCNKCPINWNSVCLFFIRFDFQYTRFPWISKYEWGFIIGGNSCDPNPSWVIITKQFNFALQRILSISIPSEKHQGMILTEFVVRQNYEF